MNFNLQIDTTENYNDDNNINDNINDNKNNDKISIVCDVIDETNNEIKINIVVTKKDNLCTLEAFDSKHRYFVLVALSQNFNFDDDNFNVKYELVDNLLCINLCNYILHESIFSDNHLLYVQNKINEHTREIETLMKQKNDILNLYPTNDIKQIQKIKNNDIDLQYVNVGFDDKNLMEEILMLLYDNDLTYNDVDDIFVCYNKNVNMVSDNFNNKFNLSSIEKYMYTIVKFKKSIIDSEDFKLELSIEYDKYQYNYIVIHLKKNNNFIIGRYGCIDFSNSCRNKCYYFDDNKKITHETQLVEPFVKFITCKNSSTICEYHKIFKVFSNSSICCLDCNLSYSCKNCSKICTQNENIKRYAKDFEYKALICNACNNIVAIMVCPSCHSSSCYCGCNKGYCNC